MLKEIESTAPVEIVVEISNRLWKYPTLKMFSKLPQQKFSISCVNVENSDLNSDIQRAYPKTILWKNILCEYC
jgi:hypothetical protein